MFGFLNYITKMTTRNIEDNGKVTTKKGKKKFDINSYDDDDTETKDDIFFSLLCFRSTTTTSSSS